MNTSAAGAQTAQTPLTSPARSNSTTRSDDPRAASQVEASPEQREAFALALHGKSSRHEDDDDDEQRDPQSDDPASALAAAMAVAPHPLRHVAPPPPARAGHVEDAPTGARAALEAALNSNPGPAVTAVGDIDPAALWEASVSEPNGITVDVRALRAERSTAQEAQPTWTLAVSSSNVKADVLARHVPRLNERLRKQGVGFSHVRIEGDQDDTE
jgi:hypothetical protein